MKEEESTCESAFGTWFSAAETCMAESQEAKTRRFTAECETTISKMWDEATASCVKKGDDECDDLIFYNRMTGATFVEQESTDNLCISYDGVAIRATDGFEFDSALECSSGCSNWGVCVGIEDADICKVDEDSSMITILGIVLGGLGAVAIGVFVYCMCCRTKSDPNDFMKA